MPTANTISFEVTDEGMAAYRDLKPGDPGSCKNIDFTTVTNDGKVVTGTIDAIEPADYAEPDADETAEAEPVAKPLAVKAMQAAEA